MEIKVKQRLIGALVLIGVIFIILPFLFHNPRPSTQLKISTAIPKPPAAPTVKAALPVIAKPKPTPKVQSTVKAAPVVVKTQTIAMRKPTTAPAKAVVTQTVTVKKKVAPIKVMKTAPVKKSKPVTHKTKVVKPRIKPAMTVKDKKPMPRLTAKIPPAWVVQLGMFSNRANAKQLAAKLNANHYNAFIRTITKNNGQKFTVVYVGPQINRDKISALQKSLKRTFRLNGFIKKYSL